jgi:filamentous hemagglutinin family protein
MTKKIMVALVLFTEAAIAKPSLKEVSIGSAELSEKGAELQITVSDKAVLHWDDFSSDVDETIRFFQPSAHAAVLNRVVGIHPSYLLGKLEANGRCFLVNSNGVFIGDKAIINTAGFLASTFDVLDKDFLEDKEWTFFGDSAAPLVHSGMIRAAGGDIYLIGKQIEVQGSLEASGTVGVIAAAGAVIKPHEHDNIFIQPRLFSIAPDESNFYQYAFDHPETGEFVIVSGSIVAKNQESVAGRVVVLGDMVRLEGDASIDASGKGGGGQVVIGGDFKGENKAFRNALSVSAGPEVKISADGIGSGDGGKVILFADKRTEFHGFISARGGEEGGNGGVVEVSGKYLLFNGLADRQAPCGISGMLYLDPINITISALGDSVNVVNPGGAGTYTFTACAPSPALINSVSLGLNLGVGPVVINTSAAGGAGCSDAGDINVTAPVTWPAGNSFTMIADRDINVSALVQSTAAGGAITLTAGRHITITNTSVENFAPSPGASVTATATTGNITLTDSTGTTTRLGNQFGTVTVEATQGSVICQVTTAGFTHGAAIGSLLPRVLGEAVSGDVIVRAGTDVSLLLPTVGAAVANRLTAGICRIGLFDNDSGSVTGNIVVTAGRDIILSSVVGSGAGSQCYAIIGQGYANDITSRPASGNTTVSAGHDLILRAGCPAGVFRRALIGNEIVSAGGPPPVNSGIITINVGNDMTLTNAPFAAPVTTSDIAYVGGGDLIHGRTTPIYANIGRNLFMDGRFARVEFLPTYSFAVAQPGFTPEIHIHAGGNIDFVGGVFVPGSQPRSSILFQEVDLTVPYTYSLYAGGSIRCVNGSVVGTCVASPYLSIPSHTASIDIRAGGDFIIGGNSEPLINLTANSNNSVYLAADHCFVEGELWAAQSALIGGNNVFTATPLGVLSAPISNDGIGGLAFDSATYNTSSYPASVALIAAGTINQTYASSLADITIESADNFVGDPFTGRAQFTAGEPANFNITTATPNNFQLITTVGDIRIAGNTVGPGCTPVDSFNNVTIAAASVATPWTTGSIYVSANNDLLVNDLIQTTGAGLPITLIGDNDDSGTGDLTLNDSVITAGGVITLAAGAGSGGGTSTIFQNVGIVDSNGGEISAVAAADVIISGAALSVSTDGGLLTVTANSGTVQVDQNITTSGGNAALSAGLDVLFTSNDALGSLVTGIGNIDIDAGRDITLNGDPTTLSTTTGHIDMVAGSNISIFQIVSSASGPISSLAGDDTTLSTGIGTPLVTTSGTILMITGNNMSLFGTSNITSTASSVVLVVDNDFPAAPGIGTGAFTMSATAQVNSGPGQPLQIFTALRPLNSIPQGVFLLNGVEFHPGTLYVDSNQEVWCTYYPDPFFGGQSFTIFYKDCLQQITEIANEVISELLFTLEPPDQWIDDWELPFAPPQIWRFKIMYGPTIFNGGDELYWISRRKFHLLHNPYVVKMDELNKGSTNDAF